MALVAGIVSLVAIALFPEALPISSRIGAILIDVVVLAWHDTPVEQPSSRLRLAPTIQKDGGGLALAMKF